MPAFLLTIIYITWTRSAEQHFVWQWRLDKIVFQEWRGVQVFCLRNPNEDRLFVLLLFLLFLLGINIQAQLQVYKEKVHLCPGVA